MGFHGEKLLLGAAACTAALALAYSLMQLPVSQVLLGTAAFVQAPAAACYAAQNAVAVQSGHFPWRTRRPDATAQPQSTPTPEPSSAPTAIPTPEPTPTPTAEPAAQSQAEVPDGMLRVEAENFPQGSGTGFVALENGSIKNATEHSDAELREAARGGVPFDVEANSTDPQVLILHTHATECYQPWDGLYYDPAFSARSQDTSQNMCAVGARMAEILNSAGINTLHDETLHDSPDYTQSYARSAQTAKDYLEKYPSIKVILDVHRDAIERDNVRIKPLCTINGEDTAQVMIICGCSNGSTINLPHWRLNLQFAAAWESAMEQMFPGLTRPVLCGYRFYNQDLSTGSLLIEIGGHANTQEEAMRGGEDAARALAVLFGGTLPQTEDVGALA